MPKDELGVVRQYDFSYGPNYTESIYRLSDKELAESDNVYWDGKIKTLQGASRVVATTIAGTTHNITSLARYVKKLGSKALVVTTDAGRAAYFDGSGWTTMAGGLSTNAKAFWHWVVFNDTLIGLSGFNNVKKWGGGTSTFTDLGGSPPKSKYASHHAVDYLFFAGHTSNPSEIRYSDTATAETWPVGNVLVIGRDDNQIIQGLQRFGDSTVVFKTNSIWLVSGNSPNDFDINPTPSGVGCVAPQSIVLTDSGVFFWSEAGPAIFNGFKTTILNQRLKSVMDEIDWDNSSKICAAMYPPLNQIYISYPRTNQTYNDRMLVFDLNSLLREKNPPVFWPSTVSGASAMVSGASHIEAERRIWFGHSTGYVTVNTDQINTFNGSVILPRIRTGALHLGKPDKTQLVRDVTLRMKAQTGRVVVKYAMDGSQTFTTHTGTPYSTAKSGFTIHQKMLEGNSQGSYMQGNILQLDISATGSTGYELHGIEVGSETVARREPFN